MADPAGPDGDLTNLLASSSDGGQFSVLGPGETVGAGLAGLAGRLDHRPGRSRGRRPGHPEPDRRRLRDRHRERPHELRGRPRPGRLLHGQVDQDVYQNMRDPRQVPGPSTCSRRRSSRRGDLPSQASGTASFSLALRPDVDTRQVDASAARHDHEPGHRPLRPADPGGLPAGRPVPTPTPRPTPGPIARPSASPDALGRRPRRARR